MGFWSRVGTALGVTRAAADINNDALFTNIGFSAPSVTGIPITQQTALQATTVMACVRIVSEDISKMPPVLFSAPRRRRQGKD
jgi:phage portal protein BeeE